MIVFLNFAPIKFMGGSEKMMLDLACFVDKKEKVVIIDTSPKMSNLYAKIFLHRSFESHTSYYSLSRMPEIISLSLNSVIPFTKSWRKVRNTLKSSRIVYARFEYPEILILLYFGGTSILKKTIAGMILSIVYNCPRGIVDKIHNLVYDSIIYVNLLRRVKRIHVLNSRDFDFLNKKYGLKSYVLPVGVDIKEYNFVGRESNERKLNIIYVGELSTRKGVDIFCDIISRLDSCKFGVSVVGEGPLKDKVIILESEKKCKYVGYISDKKLQKLYVGSDILLFPSRAESFGIVIAEAISYGLIVVNSKEITLSLPKGLEYSVADQNVDEYVKILEMLYKRKVNNLLQKQKIREYGAEYFSKELINERFLQLIIK